MSRSASPAPDPGDDEEDDGRGPYVLRTTRSKVLGGIAVAVIGAVGALGAAYLNGNAQKGENRPAPEPSAVRIPTSAPSQSPTGNQPRVSITKPAVRAILVTPGQDVDFAGTVDGLPPGNVLWLVSQAGAAGSTYYIGTSSPVATGNGQWAATVHKLGDSTDRGKSRTFFLVDADGDCSKEFLAVRNKHPRTLDGLPGSCKTLEPKIAVAFPS